MARRAVVLGGSVAGLLAARVLSERFEEVVVVERDERPDATPRKGVPQGRHVHIFLKAGEAVVESLFPGFGEALEARGAVAVDFTHDLKWFHHGVWKANFEGGLRVHMQTRPLLERLLLERVEALKQVRFMRGVAVKSAHYDPQAQRVRAVHLEHRDGKDEELPADLVVDTLGRASKLPQWLESWGFGQVRESRVEIDLQYSSRLYRAPPEGTWPWKGLAVYQTPPQQTRAGVLFPVEGGQVQVTLLGYLGDHPPTGNDGFLEFMQTLAHPALSEAVQPLTPLTDVVIHRFPYSRQFHYERLWRFPAGIVALGDAVCSFDPVFGQGITAAAKGAQVLRNALRADGSLWVKGFFARLAASNAVPWLLTSVEDFRYPVKGPRPWGLGALQAYVKRVMLLTGQSTDAYLAFTHVLHLLAGPQALFHPRILTKALRMPRAALPG